jgi:hypothetical protein
LGKEHTITIDDSSLKKPPANFHSVVARGQTEPGKNFLIISYMINDCFFFK